MHFRKNIIRILLLALWIVLGSSVLVLCVAAINIKNHKSCKGIEIEILGAKEIFFLDKNDILKIVSGEGLASPVGKALTDFNLQGLETVLERNVWVKDAELFFDNNMVLHINIIEKEPVARIFTTGGNTFYLDSSGSKMPLNNKMNVKLPVFTGFPENKKQSESNDSMLVDDIRKLTMYIMNNKFWMAQIAQVDITPERNFEIVPTVGNHIIEFGNGDNYESKFKRLFVFYRQVLSHTGIDTYSKISVQYDKQVIGTKKGMVTKVDSVQALKNIQKMIEDAKKISEDSVYSPAEKSSTAVIPNDSMIMAEPYIDSTIKTPGKELNNKGILKQPIEKSKPLKIIKPIEKKESKPKDNNPVNKAKPGLPEKPMPKAVMPRLNK